MINIKDTIVSIFGVDDLKKARFNEMDYETKYMFISQFIDTMKEYSSKFQDVDTKAITNKIISSMDSEAAFSLIYDLRDYAYFMNNKQATDRFFSATGFLMENEGKVSLKKAYESFYEDKSTLQGAISMSLSQTLKHLLVYKFPLIQELFDRLCDNNNFVTDRRLVDIISAIKTSHFLL